MPNAAAVVIVALSCFPAAARGQDATLTPTGPMPDDGRSSFSMTRLSDGRVLAIGGWAQDAFSDLSAVYSPATGTWTATPPFPFAVLRQAAQLLPDGRVMVAGGDGPANTHPAATVFFDPTLNAWTTGPDLPGLLRGPLRPLMLADGHVLVVGYLGDVAEFDPSGPGRWTVLPRVPGGNRVFCQLARLLDGRVLATGGWPETSTWIYEPRTRTWTPRAPLITPRSNAPTTLLPDGHVLVAGGTLPNGWATDVTEEYDPGTNTWTPKAPMPYPRYGQGAITLGDGSILHLGGGFATTLYARYYPGTNSWVDGPAYVPDEPTPAGGCLLMSNQVLLAGAYSSPVCLLYTPIVSGHQPVADIKASAWKTPLRVPVSFGPGASADPDGGTLRYLWDFGDASPVSTSASPTHSYLLAGTYPVTLTVTDDEGQQAVKQSTIQVIAAPSAFLSWKQVFFTPAEQADAAISGQGADPDGDGITNLHEYAFGMDPRTASGFGLPSVSIEDWHLTYAYNSYRAGTDLLFSVEFASTLSGPWSSAPGVVEEVSRTADGILDRVKVRYAQDIRSGASGFLRLQITRAGVSAMFWPPGAGTAVLGPEPVEEPFGDGSSGYELPAEAGSSGRCGSVGLDLLLLPAILALLRRFAR